ncbi:heparan-alpha-glucosaminide N-acetyltransferase-like isoform X3 [Aphidius gifuensis]|uniref:heparan-alpha-glucosaminide N-acetyltransferase-like isoform X3 n=1 Tax=Aphidius gifuensis TaxID=684658 RepID=UPI001CDD31C8|nr:heparan-alpha-glucosaminide N-acetyltransferase-like isoform X3 [Aphidius gifuensis]
MEQFSGIHLEVPSCEEAVNSSLNHACIIIDNQKSNCDWKFISRAHLSGNDFENHLKIPQHSLRTIKVNADYYYKWIIANNTIENLDSSYSERTAGSIICRIKDKKLDYGGIYTILVNNDDSCKFHDTTGFINLYKPLFYIFSIICCALALIAISKMIVKTYFTRKNFSNSGNNSVVVSAQKRKTRIQSIDTFRGGYVGPGGNSNRGSNAGCPGGAAGYMDRKILGANHLLKNSIVNMAFGSGPFEPEGILGCLTTIFHTFLGLQAGITLMSHKGKWKYIIFKFIVWSLLFGLSGLYLHCYLNVPINKNLWSLSFVLVTTSIAFVAMLMILILVDVLKWWEGGPFRIPGMNALILYIGSQVFYQTFPFHWKYGENMDNNRFLSLSVAVWDTGLWSVIAYIMHHNKLYVNL